MKQVWVLLPVKDLVQAKTRLSGVLAPFERRALAQAMVEDVLDVLTRVENLGGVLLVSDDPAAELLAKHYCVDLVQERHLGCHGLNDAVDSATAFLRARGVEHVMVMHSDLPLLQEADVDALLRNYQALEDSLLIAPDRVGNGTNVMMFAICAAPEFQYGEGSCQAHCDSAARRGLSVSFLRRKALQCDIDNPADVIELWQQLRRDSISSRCSELLCEGDISQRLAMMEQAGVGQEKTRESEVYSERAGDDSV